MATQIVQAPTSTETAGTAPLPLIVGFRIMRQFEVAPGWWGKAVEVGETGSGAVAYSFCKEQNRVTMDPNRLKRIEYYADPIYAEAAPTTPLPPAAAEALARLQSAFAGQSLADRLAHEAGSYVRVTPEVQRAVTRYEVAAERYRELTTLSREMTSAEFDSLSRAQNTMAESTRVLTVAGQLDLIGGA